ncbi:MAG: hypothetical protein ACM3KE_11650, partial [Hyphomicrobiales bacterium]
RRASTRGNDSMSWKPAGIAILFMCFSFPAICRVRHSRESGNPNEAAGFRVKPGMTVDTAYLQRRRSSGR